MHEGSLCCLINVSVYEKYLFSHFDWNPSLNFYTEVIFLDEIIQKLLTLKISYNILVVLCKNQRAQLRMVFTK